MSPDDFLRETAADLAAIEAEVTASLETAAEVAGRKVVEKTRERSGRARSSWKALKSRAARPVAGNSRIYKSRATQTPKQLGQRARKIAAKLKAGQALFITSNLPYISDLDEHDGIIDAAVQEVEKALK